MIETIMWLLTLVAYSFIGVFFCCFLMGALVVIAEALSFAHQRMKTRWHR